jgi:hypothetical protein
VGKAAARVAGAGWRAEGRVWVRMGVISVGQGSKPGCTSVRLSIHNKKCQYLANMLKNMTKRQIFLAK